VTVYTKPDCPGCTLTKSILQKAGVDFEVIDLTRNPDAMTYVTKVLGVQTAPVVVADVLDKPIVGFRAAALQGLIGLLGEQPGKLVKPTEVSALTPNDKEREV